MKPPPSPNGSVALRVSRKLTAVSLIFVLISVSSFSTADDDVSFKAIRRTSPEIGAGDLYALVVGVSTYRSYKIPQLKLAAKDARDFAALLNAQKTLFRRTDIHLLVNEEATEREIRKYLDYKLSRATKDDTVIVFLSGHGATDPSMPGDFFFVAYDTDPEYLASTAVNMTESRFLKRLSAKRIVLFADTCHSGGFSNVATKSLETPLKSLARQIAESEGKVMLASSRDDEVSIEKPNLPNSIFTYYLIQGLKGEAADKDGIVTLKNLYDFVHKETVQETSGIQHPRLVGNLEGSFPLTLATLQPPAVPRFGSNATVFFYGTDLRVQGQSRAARRIDHDSGGHLGP